MIPRLRNDRDTLASHLEDLQGLTGLPYTQPEKDFWLTEALRGVVAVADDLGLPVYFKGGTSLSKVHGIIERFSEDVDVLVGLPKTDELMTANQRNRALRALAAGASEATGLSAETDVGKTRKGDKRAVYLAYRDADDAAGALAPLRPEGVLVELGRWGGSQPHTQAEISSVLADHAGELALEPFEELAPVTINVVDPIRTTVEKLLLLENAAADPDKQRRRAVARHYYDIWCLLQHPPTREQLQRPGVASAIAGEVFVHTHYFKHPDHKTSVRERPMEGFAASEAFAADNPALKPTRDAYDTTVLNGLLWPTAARRPSFDECCRAVTTFDGGL